MEKIFKIGNNFVGNGYPPFIIAEMSGNHRGSLKRALKIVDEVAKSGANAIKLQTYTADTITVNSKNKEFIIQDKNSIWYKRNLYDLYNEAHTPWKWHPEIFKRAKENNLICFSSPFDETAVDFLENLKAPAYKIASFEINHIPLIKKVAATGKPIIISTGMATEKEINEAINAAKSEGAKKIILLKCTSEYPASIDDSNLLSIPFMKKKFNCQIGLSDHTEGIAAPIAAVTLGASVIEKHITLNKNDGAVDSKFSLEVKDLKSMVEECINAWRASGKKKIGPSQSERKSLHFRRSIYVIKNLVKGDIINKNNIKVVRPSNGIHPKYFNYLLGKKVNTKIKQNSPFKLSYLKKK